LRFHRKCFSKLQKGLSVWKAFLNIYYKTAQLSSKQR
jgi:hypothetical protein